MKRKTKRAGVSDSAVVRATGKTWSQWFELLDRAGADKMSHPQIADWLAEQHIDSGWWAQMVTVGYEQARGLRALHQTADGFVATLSKTFNVSLDELYAAWSDAKTRAHWLHEKGVEITKSTANKSLRLVWHDGASRVDVNFYPKGNKKSQVTIDHHALDDEAHVQRSKTSWKQALNELAEWLSRQG